MNLPVGVLPAILALGGSAAAQGDPKVIEALLYEGKENSRVWKSLTYLSETIGTRLTGSTGLQRANEWTRIESGSGGREGKNYNFVHHTQHDTLRYAVEEYLVQSATCSAVVANKLAQAETLLPGEAEEAPPPPDPTFVSVPGELSGEWEVALVDPDAPDFTLTLEMARDGRLRGSVSSMMGTTLLSEGQWNAETKEATFASVTDVGKMGFQTRLEEGVLHGTMSAMGQDMRFRGEPKPNVGGAGGRAPQR